MGPRVPACSLTFWPSLVAPARLSSCQPLIPCSACLPASRPLILYSSACLHCHALQAFILYIVADFFWILLEPRAVPSK